METAGKLVKEMTAMKQWLERLVEQLTDLEECREEVTGEEFELMKEQTVQQIKKFSQALDRLQQGDTAEEPEISQLNVNLRNLVYSSFNNEELMKYFGTAWATDLALQLQTLEEDFKLKKVDSVVYFEQKRRILKESQYRGWKLSRDQIAFLAEVE